MLAGGRPALLIYGESDPLRARFQDQLTQPSWAALEQYKSLFTYAVIPAANHILGEPGAVDEANRLTAVWLDAILSASKSASPVFGPHRGAQPRAAQA